MAALYDENGNYIGDDGSTDTSGLYGTGSTGSTGLGSMAATDMGTYDIPAGVDPYATTVAAPALTPAQQYAAYGAGGGGAGNQGVGGSGMDNGTTAAPTTDWSTQAKDLAAAMGLTNKDGSYNLSKIMGLGAAGATLASSLNQPAYQAKTTAQILAGMSSNTPGNHDAMLAAMATPMKSGTNLARATPAASPLSIVAGTRGYAQGGPVAPMPDGPLSQVPPPGPSGPTQPFSGAVEGDDPGQSDLIDAKLSAGEYVFDAESVSMIGDGNTQAGIAKLDQLRQELRAQKRAAPAGQIPAPTGALSQLNGAANG